MGRQQAIVVNLYRLSPLLESRVAIDTRFEMLDSCKTEEIVDKKKTLVDSAAGGAKETKNASQAILPLRGKIKNCTSLELADAIKSDIIKDILNCLGCGIGDHFNINNLRYNRIIIMCDADSDGKHIELLLMTLFLHHLPELVKQGKIFAATPPLFRTKSLSGEIKYWYEDNAEYRKYVRGHKNLEIVRFKGLN